MWDLFVIEVKRLRQVHINVCCSVLADSQERLIAANRLEELDDLMRNVAVRKALGAPPLPEPAVPPGRELLPDERFSHDGGY